MVPLKVGFTLEASLLLIRFLPQVSSRLYKELSGVQGDLWVTFLWQTAFLVTGHSSVSEILTLLEKNEALQHQFQQEVIKFIALTSSLSEKKISSLSAVQGLSFSGEQSSWRGNLMVGTAALGLLACLGSLAYFRPQLPGEVVGIISTIAGIFGSCLKDAYTFEFGTFREKPRDKKEE